MKYPAERSSGTPSLRTLPDGWRWVRLREVIRETQAGFACGQRDADGVVQLRMNNLDTRGNFVWDDVLRVPREGNNIEQFLLVPGDVLFNNTNSTELVGKSAQFDGYVEPIVYSNHFTRLRTVSDSLLPAFLSSWLNHQWQQGVFAAICNRWIGQSAVKADRLLSLEFPLPPLPEQQRIAGVLREQMTAVEKTRAAAQARLAAVKALPAAFLRQVFPQPGQPLPAGWRWVKLGEVCEIVRGSSPRPKGDPRYYGGNVPRLMVEDVTRDVMYVTPRVDFLTEVGATLSRPMMKGDVVIVVSGAPGLPAILNVDACIHDGFVGLRKLQIEKLTQEFLFYFLRRSRELTDKEATGAIFRNLTTYQVGNIAIPLPPLSEQRRIAAVLRVQMAAVEKARAAAEAELNTVNTLPAALLRRAFNGEI
ncbi:MAG: restriction endonuclease subunit S [Chloroflexi bacterium]|nr:restriction endonuclease subunit S [Chloroflexota bacterium]